jgi:hypothetical protein
MNNRLLHSIGVAALLACSTKADAQIPTNFPTVTVTTNYAAGTTDGYIFLANNISPTNVGYYVMMLTNDGSPFWYKALTNAGYDFKVLPNGYLHYAQQIKALSYTGGGDVTHEILDENYNSIESIHGGNGYAAEAHDFQMLPNGNVLQFGYYLSELDMSQVVTNGNPAALVSGAVLQELDGQRNVVFQWRFWDHYPFTSQWVNSTAATISEWHVNCIFQDTDGNIIVSTPDWVKKISRQTGDIMWHLGGPENQFTFVGVTQQQGTNQFRSHGINRLANGHVLIYNNSAAGPGTTSSVHEYALDEVNKIATHIWTYTPNPAIQGPNQGNAQRLANGNTFIGWGGSGTAVCAEVSDTNVVFQAKFNTANINSYRSYRFAYPPASQANENSVTEVATGNSYTFGSTGVTLEMVAGGGGYNRLTVTRFPYAPVYPLFQDKAPRVLPVRVQLSESAVDNLTANIDFDAISFGIPNPANITIAYRSQSGQGLFVPQTTTYNPVTGKLSVSIALSAQAGDLGEFIFTYPDLADIAYPPILAQAENYRGVQLYNVTAPKMAVTGMTYTVNQQLPISLSWSPKGLSRYSEFELATDNTFSSPLVQVPFQTDAFYVWNGAAPNTTYYYRARTHTDTDVSDWSVGSFRTIAPFVTLTSPNGGEFLRRGLRYFVRWQDNIPENINLDLYKAGSRLRGIVTNAPSNGAFQWQVPLDLIPGSDYTIKITSATNSAMADFSDQTFSIDAPFIDSKTIAQLPDGSFSFGIAAYGSTQVVVSASSDFVSWQDLGLVNLTNGLASFVDTGVTNFPKRFYRVRLP